MLEQVLKAGVSAIQAVGVSINVDYVDKEFQRLVGRIESSLKTGEDVMADVLEAVFAEDSGSLARALKTYLGEDGRLSELFDPARRDSAIGKIAELLNAHFGGEGSKLYQLLDLANTSSPLHKWKTELHGEFQDIRALIEKYRTEMAQQLAGEKARAEERDKGALKGRAYEALVFAAVNEVADVFGDVPEPTGDQPGLGGSKVGDVVATLNARDTRGVPLRMVFEAKDKAIGLTPIRRELEEARTNRNAAVAVAVYSQTEYMPPGTAPFRDLSEEELLCLYDKNLGDPMTLQLAYRVARLWALAGLRRQEVELDATGVREDLDAARVQLKAIASMKSQLTKVRSAVSEGADQLERELDRLREELSKVFERIEGRLRFVATRPESTASAP
ncbi:MAG: hypothetical protein HY002_14550 [Candidatus Rokubacteria bacterium]|nr:hypothetical protein [Candidatus Rokubacteria bacterium]